MNTTRPAECADHRVTSMRPEPPRSLCERILARVAAALAVCRSRRDLAAAASRVAAGVRSRNEAPFPGGNDSSTSETRAPKTAYGCLDVPWRLRRRARTVAAAAGTPELRAVAVEFAMVIP